MSPAKQKTRLVLTFLLCLMLLLTLGFIFWNSLLPREASAGLSSSLLSKITAIIGTESTLARFIVTYFRKIAHFAEFAFLALSLNGICIVWRRMRKTMGWSLLFGLLVAVIDESLQLISLRGSSTTDVLIDFSGYLASTVLLWFLMLLFHRKEV